MLFKTSKNFIFIYKQNVNERLTKILFQFTEFCSSVSVIDLKQVNTPLDTFHVITVPHFHAQIQQ